jgi:hypothetical protein
MRDFISVVPFFACKAPGCSHPGERNRHLHLIRSTEFGTSPPQGDRFQLISRFERDYLILDPTFGDVQRTADACVIEITFLSGRTDAQKRRLYSELAARAAGIGFAEDDLVVGLMENGAIDWSLGRGRAYVDK